MSYPFTAWRHVFKLDPDREIGDEALGAVCASGTDAVLVGGSSGVTFNNTVELLSRIRRFEVDCALEVSGADAAAPGFDYYFIPLVLNTASIDWLSGKQTAALAEYGPFIPWERTAAEGYIILNPDAEAARVARAVAPLGERDVLAHAAMADRLMRLPIVYLEYSGRFGDMELLRRVGSELTGARLFYGGGIDGAEKAAQAAAAAHTVIVGNVVYGNLEAALQTVSAVKQTPCLLPSKSN